MSTNYCQNCGATLSPSAKFCNRCGTPIASISEATTPAQSINREGSPYQEEKSIYDYGHEKKEYDNAQSVEFKGVEGRKQGGCLSAFLALALIGNVALGLLSLLNVGEVGELSIIAALLNFAGAGFAIAIWKWQKWGVYGYIAVIGITALINLATGYYTAAAQGIVPIVFLSLLIRPVWGQMD